MPIASCLAINASPATLAGLNPLDWAVVVVTVFSMFLGYLRGLIRSLVSLCGVLMGIVVAAWYAPRLASVLVQWVSNTTASWVLAFLLILSVTYVAAMLLGTALRGAARAVGLGFFDRVGGAFFGFARSVVVLAALLLAARPYLHSVPFTHGSLLLPYLQSAAHGVSFVVPQDFGRRLLAGAGRRTAATMQHSTTAQITIEGEAQ